MLLQNAVQLEIAVERKLIGMCRNRDEVGRERFDITKPSGNSKQEVFVEVVEVRERTNGVAGISTHAEFINSPDVDRDTHSLV